MKQITLMDKLAEAVGCEYISQLPYAKITASQADGIRKLADEGFPMKQYNEAARYIMHSLRSYKRPEDALEDLISTMMIRPEHFPYM